MGGGLYQMNINTKEIVRCPTTTTSNTDWTKVNMLHNSWINCLLHTAEDKLYIGTYDGLGCLDIKTMDFVSPMKNRRILYGDVIYALHEGKDGNIWIGTSKGLKRLNPRTVEVQEYTTKMVYPAIISAQSKRMRMVIFGSVRIMESADSILKTKVSLIFMQVTDYKVTSLVKEPLLPTNKVNLSLEVRMESLILIPQK